MGTTEQQRDPLLHGLHGLTAATIRKRIERRLDELVPSAPDSPQRLHEAMRYSLLAGGKRVRPIVTLMVTDHLGGQVDLALDPACAIEMVHTASLILDDLPCMDDARLRRGRPANHLVFGENTAVLAALALLNEAYAVLARSPQLAPELRLTLVEQLTRAIGSDGLIGGQERDLNEGDCGQDPAALERIHDQKTAALFVICVELGARIAGVDDDGRLEPLRSFGRNLGLAFQILDDLLDASGDESAAGKDVGKDESKHTFVTCMGPERARLRANRFVEAAAQALAPLAPASEPLVELTFSLIDSISPAVRAGGAASSAPPPGR